MVTLLKLSYFLEAAKTCSFSDAAKRLYTTQPSVSKQIALLEKDLGCELFYRRKGQVELTKAGEFLFNELQDLPDKIHESCLKASAIGREDQGRVSIGIFRRVAGYQLQVGILEFAKTHPELVFDVEREEYSHLCDGFLEARYDMIITDEVELPVFQGKYEQRYLFDTPLALAVSDFNPLSKEKQVSLSDLKDYQFIVQVPREIGCCSDQVEALFHRAGFEPNIRRTVYSLESLFLYTSMDEGVAVIEENNGVINSPNLKLVHLEPPVSMPVYALWSSRISAKLAQEITDWLIASRT